MEPPGADVVLVREGEVGTKSEGVRRRMERELARNVEAMLADRGLGGEIERRRFRLLVHTDEPGAVCAAVTDVFGVVSASAAARTEPTLDGISTALAAAARDRYESGTFAVRANRAGEPDAHPFSSHDIEERGGAAVWEAAEDEGVDPAVDLDDPDAEFFVDCRSEEAFVFLEKRPGPGGLPLGTQRPVVALVSGGIDSPVAAWEAMRRGCPVIPLYVDLGEYGGVDHRTRVLSTVDALADYAPGRDVRLRHAPAGETVAEIADAVEEGRMLVLRRLMFRIAERVARDEGAAGIVTGESIGQKSSQTSANLAATSAVTDLPVHRSLVTTDKTEITDRAREIGTYDDSTVRTGCNRLVPAQPMTAATPEEARAREPDGLDERADRIAERIEVVDPSGPVESGDRARGEGGDGIGAGRDETA